MIIQNTFIIIREVFKNRQMVGTSRTQEGKKAKRACKNVRPIIKYESNDDLTLNFIKDVLKKGKRVGASTMQQKGKRTCKKTRLFLSTIQLIKFD